MRAIRRRLRRPQRRRRRAWCLVGWRVIAGTIFKRWLRARFEGRRAQGRPPARCRARFVHLSQRRQGRRQGPHTTSASEGSSPSARYAIELPLTRASGGRGLHAERIEGTGGATSTVTALLAEGGYGRKMKSRSLATRGDTGERFGGAISARRPRTAAALTSLRPKLARASHAPRSSARRRIPPRRARFAERRASVLALGFARRACVESYDAIPRGHRVSEHRDEEQARGHRLRERFYRGVSAAARRRARV